MRLLHMYSTQSNFAPGAVLYPLAMQPLRTSLKRMLTGAGRSLSTAAASSPPSANAGGAGAAAALPASPPPPGTQHASAPPLHAPPPPPLTNSSKSWMEPMNLTPAQVVEALSQHIVGQLDAKKAIAVALRNRWRRMRLTAAQQAEIIPKNILMVSTVFMLHLLHTTPPVAAFCCGRSRRNSATAPFPSQAPPLNLQTHHTHTRTHVLLPVRPLSCPARARRLGPRGAARRRLRGAWPSSAARPL
jgi:hypothetical protein